MFDSKVRDFDLSFFPNCSIDGTLLPYPPRAMTMGRRCTRHNLNPLCLGDALGSSRQSFKSSLVAFEVTRERRSLGSTRNQAISVLSRFRGAVLISPIFPVLQH